METDGFVSDLYRVSGRFEIVGQFFANEETANLVF